MSAHPPQNVVRNAAKMFLATTVMRLARFRRIASQYPGARIVMYHEVPSTTARQFREHLSYFANNYEVVSLDRLSKALINGDAVDNWLAITFDDGFKDNIEIVAPLLQEFGLKACFFVTTQFVSLDPLNRDGCRRFATERFQRPDQLPAMNWDDLAFLLEKGFIIGSHSRSHANLASLSLDKALSEINGSRADIENHLGNIPTHFSWPFGKSEHFGEHLQRLVQDAGYVSACSAERGINCQNTPMYHLKRDHLEPHWSLTMVQFFLEGGYEWLRRLQGWNYFFEGVAIR